MEKRGVKGTGGDVPDRRTPAGPALRVSDKTLSEHRSPATVPGGKRGTEGGEWTAGSCLWLAPMPRTRFPTPPPSSQRSVRGSIATCQKLVSVRGLGRGRGGERAGGRRGRTRGEVRRKRSPHATAGATRAPSPCPRSHALVTTPLCAAWARAGRGRGQRGAHLCVLTSSHGGDAHALKPTGARHAHSKCVCVCVCVCARTDASTAHAGRCGDGGREGRNSWGNTENHRVVVSFCVSNSSFITQRSPPGIAFVSCVSQHTTLETLRVACLVEKSPKRQGGDCFCLTRHARPAAAWPQHSAARRLPQHPHHPHSPLRRPRACVGPTHH